MSDLQQRIEQVSEDGGLSCQAAFSIAEEAGVSPERVREEADGIGVRIVFCQLGLFGYHAFDDKRFIIPLARVPDQLATAIVDATAEGALSCAAAWSIADRMGLPRPVAGSAAETLGISIMPCQLGCFGSSVFGEKHGG